MKNIIYDKRFLLIIRCISILCIIFLVFIETFDSVTMKKNTFANIYDFASFCINILAIVFFFVLAIFPYKLEFLAIISFIYSLCCLVFDKNNPIGILMYVLSNAVLYVRGFFIRNTKQKILISVIIYIALLLGELHFGISVFLNSLVNKLGYSLVLSIICFLLFTNKKESNDIDIARKLNLAEYPLLVPNDIPLLQNVLQNKQYKEIAMIVRRSEGTIRNRLNKIYDILGVMDRKGFIMTYFGYDIVFEEIKSNQNSEALKASEDFAQEEN